MPEATCIIMCIVVTVVVGYMYVQGYNCHVYYYKTLTCFVIFYSQSKKAGLKWLMFLNFTRMIFEEKSFAEQWLHVM